MKVATMLQKLVQLVVLGEYFGGRGTRAVVQEATSPVLLNRRSTSSRTVGAIASDGKAAPRDQAATVMPRPPGSSHCRWRQRVRDRSRRRRSHRIFLPSPGGYQMQETASGAGTVAGASIKLVWKGRKVAGRGYWVSGTLSGWRDDELLVRGPSRLDRSRRIRLRYHTSSTCNAWGAGAGDIGRSASDLSRRRTSKAYTPRRSSHLLEATQRGVQLSLTRESLGERP
ncbi:hypothetical protein EJ06DRAFT_346153 [Trichodelitschia bisporula]|uniref:Uncharacterized protein n=1 Tax=Trichodelitschia bisporula TaxID=703511 RepID=A0A6G1I3L9_9PEZI|nr:hypothetical protein EJ06DRAFT_346153 [Trichodelitschia bisporula]